MSISPTVAGALVSAAQATPGLELLMLFGSRAREASHAGSDWDFAYLARENLDPALLLATLVEILGSDRIDLVDIGRASGLLRYRAARDGQIVYEARRGIDERFRLEAAQFWCEAAPVLRRGYEDVLTEIER